MCFQKVLVTKDSLPQLTDVEQLVYQSNTNIQKAEGETFALVGIILAPLESLFPLRSEHLLLPGTADWNQSGRIQRAMNHNRVCISRLLVHASSDQGCSARHTKTCSANAPPDVAYSWDGRVWLQLLLI